MKKRYKEIRKLAVSKARQSSCRHKISAIGFNKKGEIIYTATNKPRFDREGGSVHAEMEVMLRAGPGLRTILIARVSKQGELLPVDPCATCARMAGKLGISILSVVP